MAKRKRRSERYSSGDCALGWRGKWAVAVYPNESTGKRQRIRLGEYDKNDKSENGDLQKAKDALNQFAERRRLIKEAQKAYTVGALWEKWLADRKEDGFSNDIYEAQWVALKPAFEHRLPHLIETQDFRDYARDRFALGRSSWTVHNELVRLRSCLKWSFKRRLIPVPIDVWVPSPGGNRDRVMTSDEAKLLLAGASEGDPHICLFVILAFATGARHTAILDLTWDRVDFVKGTICFDENLPKDPMSKSWRKGRATVPMNQLARRALEASYAGRQTDHVIEHGGKRLKTVRSGFENAVERAGLGQRIPHPKKPDQTIFVTDITPHTIRHTVLTWLNEAGVATSRRAQFAGHGDERTTDLIYTHPAPRVLMDAVEILDDAFAPLPRIGHEPIGEQSSNVQKQRSLSRRDNSGVGQPADPGE